MSAHDAELRAYWQRAVATATDPLEALLDRYREAHRHYHTVAHVGWVLRHVDELAPEAVPDDLDAVIAAAFYHDAIYDPTHTTNEADSAALARRDLAGFADAERTALADAAAPGSERWTAARIDAVAAMIEGTATHLDPPDAGTAVLYDADLAVLGAEPTAYDDYVRGVRAEYHHVDDEAWRTGRAAVLQAFLDRPAVYATPAGRSRWEAVARANLTAELATLR